MGHGLRLRRQAGLGLAVGWSLAVADYSNGHLYPLEANPFPRGSFSTSRLDMPWVGLCSLERGHGYMIIVDTSDNGSIGMFIPRYSL